MDSRAIGVRLKEMRGGRRIADVAECLEISISALSMYESGQRIPRDEIKKRIAGFYGKSIEEIFFAD